MSDAQTQGAFTAFSSISAVRFGVEGVMGLQNGELQVTEVRDLETKDARHHRIKTREPMHRAVRWFGGNYREESSAPPGGVELIAPPVSQTDRLATLLRVGPMGSGTQAWFAATPGRSRLSAHRDSRSCRLPQENDAEMVVGQIAASADKEVGGDEAAGAGELAFASFDPPHHCSVPSSGIGAGAEVAAADRGES